MDAHCHLSLLGAGLRYEEEIPHSNEFMAVTAVYNAQVMLKSGVTTLRDNGCRDSIMFGVRDAMDRGLLVGPRMLLAGRPVTMTGGHFFWCNGTADGDDEIWREIRKLVQEGADHIKIMASGGGTEGTNPGLPSYTARELRTAVDGGPPLRPPDHGALPSRPGDLERRRGRAGLHRARRVHGARRPDRARRRGAEPRAGLGRRDREAAGRLRACTPA